jgi:hypothetical protein
MRCVRGSSGISTLGEKAVKLWRDMATLIRSGSLILRGTWLSIRGWRLRHGRSRGRESGKLGSVERLGLLLLLGSGW